MNNSPFIHAKGAKFLNLPAAVPVMREVFDEDCYRFDEIPEGCIVIDVGAFYGEFGIAARVDRNCKVLAFEPSLENFLIATLNAEVNQIRDDSFAFLHCAIGDDEERVSFLHSEEHPAGSRIVDVGNPSHSVHCWTIRNAINFAKEKYGYLTDIFLKLDCEGSEREIFDGDTKWLDRVSILAMEWHNKDGHVYAEILKKAGFEVELTGGGPKPRPAWEPEMSGGLIFAKRPSDAA